MRLQDAFLLTSLLLLLLPPLHEARARIADTKSDKQATTEDEEDWSPDDSAWMDEPESTGSEPGFKPVSAGLSLQSLSGRVRRSYKEKDNAYIRFGKRANEDHYSPSRRSAAESAYIRFGKRGNHPFDEISPSSFDEIPSSPSFDVEKRAGFDGSLMMPCSVNYLRALPTAEMRLKHLQGCSITRSIRSEDDGYIRFGKRSTSNNPSGNNRCLYLAPGRLGPIVRDCSEMAEKDELRKIGEVKSP